MRRWLLVPAALMWCLSFTDAAAQVTIGGGVSWPGGYDIGSSTAELRRNATGSANQPFALFVADSRISRSIGGEVRVGVALSRRVAIEGGAAFARPRIAVTISADTEAGAQSLDGESLQQYLFDAALAWHLPKPASLPVGPFLLAGAGYLRQLHQDRTLVESGQVYYAGAGARYWLKGGPDAPRSLGLRGDVRVNLRRNGIDFENATRVFPTASLHFFLGL